MKKLFVLTFVLATLLAPATAAGSVERGPLLEYLERPDPSFTWVERQTGQELGIDFAELTLTSQIWRGTVWKHQLFIIKPPDMPADAKSALIYITGGKWKPKYEGPASGTRLPKSAPMFARLAKVIGTPVIVLRNVPLQPLFDNKKEDALIAHTFENYLRTGEADWPLLLPMVKSTVRAMDAVQAYARATWNLEIEHFTVSGASKRGWTTWLTGAVDPRVAAIAPIVIDVLNMKPHLAHQQAVWGEPSFKIADYTERGLHQQLETDAGQRLREIVDPYTYRDRLTLPKLIVVGTNDRYWPVDALNLYWDDLPGRKYILYVPNEGHRINDHERLIGSVNAVHQHVARGKPLPTLDWRFNEGVEGLRLSIESDRQPDRVLAWVATSPTRDFRDAHWKSHLVERSDDGWQVELDMPEHGYAAMFGEVHYENGEAMPFSFSTNLRVIGKGGSAADARPAPPRARS